MIQTGAASAIEDMATYETTAETSWPIEVTFDYLAEFSNVSEWDPGVNAARTITEEALSEGARFEVEVADLFGRPLELTYETIEIERPDRAVIRAENATIISLDTLTFEELADGGTRVTYHADLKLKGPLRLADPILRLAFKRIGDKARNGLRERLSDPVPPRTPIVTG